MCSLFFFPEGSYTGFIGLGNLDEEFGRAKLVQSLLTRLKRKAPDMVHSYMYLAESDILFL